MSTIYTARTDTAWGVFNADGLISEHRTRAEARAAKQAAAATPEPEAAPVEDVTPTEEPTADFRRDYTGTLAPAMVPFAQALAEQFGRGVTVTQAKAPVQGDRRLVVSGPESAVEAFDQLLSVRETQAFAAMKTWAQENRAELTSLSQSHRRTANRAFLVDFATKG